MIHELQEENFAPTLEEKSDHLAVVESFAMNERDSPFQSLGF